MDYLVAVLTLLILAFLYWRMIKREIPDPIKPFQAILPFALGILSMIIYSPYILWFITNIAPKISIAEGIHPFFRGMFSAFLMAGFPEEVLKLIFILITLAVLRSKVRNVYEYILIGAAVGAGFTVAEEWLYADKFGITTLIMRTMSVAGHMSFNMVMAEYLGLSRVAKLTGKGSPVKYAILAFVVPCLIHTLYDTCTTGNTFLLNESTQIIGAILGGAAYIFLVVFQISVLIRFKKKTKEFCEMSVQPE